MADTLVRCGGWEDEGRHDTPLLLIHLVLGKLDDILSRNILNAFDKAYVGELFHIHVILQKCQQPIRGTDEKDGKLLRSCHLLDHCNQGLESGIISQVHG